MTGADASLHYVYLFPSKAEATATVNVSWELMYCSVSTGQTLTCTSRGQSVLQITPGDPTLQIGDQNYGAEVTLNMVPAST